MWGTSCRSAHVGHRSVEYFCPPCCRMPVPSSIFSHQRPNLHTNEHLNGLDDIIDLQLEIFLSRSLCLRRIKCAKRRTNRARTHTLMQEDEGEKWLLFCILMRVISCVLAMADKGTYLCPGPLCPTGGKCPLQRPALIVSEHVVRPIIIIIMGN